MIRTALVYVCFWLGSAALWLCETIGNDFPHEEWIIDLLCRLYSKLMWISSELDRDEKVWVRQHENESDEEFERRVKERYPESYPDYEN